MISKRGLIAAGALGVGSAILMSTNAFACSIQDFTHADISCVAATGQGAVTITDNDYSETVTITVTQKGADKPAGTATVTPKDDHQVVIPVPWTQGATYVVHVQTAPGSRYVVDQDYPQTLQVPADTECGARTAPSSTPSTPAPAQPAPLKPTPSSTPSATASTTPTSKTTPAQQSAATAAPSASQSAAGSSLAETGGGSDTGPMIGIAAALVVVGGGAVVVTRRRAARNH